MEYHAEVQVYLSITFIEYNTLAYVRSIKDDIFSQNTTHILPL
jgi:hypothetical protein